MTIEPPAPADPASAPGLEPYRQGVVHTSSELQAIRDRDGAKVGYELFYRDSETATSAADRNTAATLRVLAGLTAPLRHGQPPRTHLYFVNVTRDFLVGRIGLPNPSEIAVLEIPPDVYADAAVRRGCGELRDRGYGIALDRYLPGRDNHHDDLLPLASHVKLDLSDGDEPALRQAARQVRERCNALVVGCRLGTPRLVDLAREIGCDLFQGHTLDDAERQTQQSIAGSLSSYIRLLELLAPEDSQVDLRQVTEAVMGNADLSTRVLRACNSAGAGATREITSIQQAVVLLGVHELRQRVHLAVAQGLEVGNESHLLQVIEYAALTELVGVGIGVPAGTGFLTGLLVEVAEVLDMRVARLVADMPLGRGLTDDLLHRRGAVGQALDLVDAYKRGVPPPQAPPVDLPTMHVQAQLAAAGVAGSLGDLAGPATLPPVGGPDPDEPAPEPPATDPPGSPVAGTPESPLAGAPGAPLAGPPGSALAGAPGAPLAGLPGRTGVDLATVLGPPPADRPGRTEQRPGLAQELQRRRLREGSVPAAELAARLGCDQAQVAGLLARGGVSRYQVDGVLRVPLWQFTVDGELIAGVEAVVRDFPGDAGALAEWIVQPCQGLGRDIPLALLLQGRAAVVADHVRGLRP